MEAEPNYWRANFLLHPTFWFTEGFDVTKALQLDAKNVNAYNNRGNALLVKRHYDRAISDYDVAIQLDPKYSIAYFNRGNAYDGKGFIEQAIRDYEKALDLNPIFTPAYINRGNAYKKKVTMRKLYPITALRLT